MEPFKTGFNSESRFQGIECSGRMVLELAAASRL